MKHGRYLRLPERSADVAQLWREATPLDPCRLPAWLEETDAGYYRLAATIPVAGMSDVERAAYVDERADLAALGLVIEADADDPNLERFYLAEPPREPMWSIGVCRGSSPFGLAPTSQRPAVTGDAVTGIAASYVADPFAVRVGETWHLFFEAWNWRAYKGEIVHATSRDGRHWSGGRVVLAEPFHLSYPLTFESGGSFYMIPESHQARAVRLYRARQFPEDWEFVATLVEGSYLVDATVFRHGGRWWMFADSSPTQDHDTLRLYGANALTGPWVEHPASPVVASDARNARPAGRAIEVAGQPMRFAQCCTPEYGTDVRAFVIDELTTTHYCEQPAGVVLGPSGSGWNAAGMHHIDAHDLGGGEWLAFVDGWHWPNPGN